MEYFVKYLPASGNFWYVGAIVRDTRSGMVGRIKKVGEGLDETKIQHLKAYLCTLEFGIGDKLYRNDYLENGPVWIISKTRADGKFKVEGVYGWYEMKTLQKNFFKALAPISVAATWLQEGQWLDDTQVSQKSGVVGLHELTILVKCPTCESFH